MKSRAGRQLWRHPSVAALLAAILAYGVAGTANPIETSPEAVLIARARRALGPGFGRVKSLHAMGTFNAGTINGTTDTWIDLAQGRYTFKTDAGPLSAGYGYDGHISWRSDSKGIILPQTGPMAKAIAASQAFDGTYALYRAGYGGATVSYLGLRSDAGHSYEAIAVTPKGGYAEEMWFDPATALPARTIVDYGNGPTTTSFSGYHSVGGLMIAEQYKITKQSILKDFYGHKLNSISLEASSKYYSAEVDIAHIGKHVAM